MKNQEYIKEHYTWEDLQRVVHVLMQPDGCPWDSTRDYDNMKECVLNEAAEVAEAVDNKDFINLREELGDLLFAAVNVARHEGIDSEYALTCSCEKFIRRFEAAEKIAVSKGIDMKAADSQTLDEIWKEAKKNADSK